MRTFVTGMVFMSVLTAALYGIMLLDTRFSEGQDMFAMPVAADELPESLARFEPSSTAIVNEMVNMAGVIREDIVYDLGCGDGRVVIAAARARGAQGVGVDIDPELIDESRRNAEKAKVSHLVRFFQEDLITTDISRATVVMLYLSPDANLMLRPKLLRELKPGTRVVSHSHDMGEWEPDRKTRVESHHIYSWIVPAELSGSWNVAFAETGAPTNSVIEFSQSFQRISGLLIRGKSAFPLAEPQLQGRLLEFTMDREWGPIAAGARFSGLVEKDRIRGRFHSRSGSGAWEATRTP